MSRWMKAASGREADAVVQIETTPFTRRGSTVGVRQALADVSGWVDFFVLAVRLRPPITRRSRIPNFNGVTSSVELARLAGGAAQSRESKETSSAIVKGPGLLAFNPDDTWILPLVLASSESKGAGTSRSHGWISQDAWRGGGERPAPILNGRDWWPIHVTDHVLGDLA